MSPRQVLRGGFLLLRHRAGRGGGQWASGLLGAGGPRHLCVRPLAARVVPRLPPCGGGTGVNDLWLHGEVARDEVECVVRGDVEGLAGGKPEDVVGSSPLELPLHHEQGGPGVGAGEGPLLPIADHAASRSTSMIHWVRGPVSSFMSSWAKAMGR